MDHFLLANPATEHAHNSIICAIIHNTTRDVPDPGPAAWVSAATDKASTSAPTKAAASGDAAEQRIKTEVMKLPRRDRARLKAVATEKSELDDVLARRNEYEEFYTANRIRAPESIPNSGGGLTKTNWELEIKKRYIQPLFSETVEFPDASTIYARMMPICYEEAVPGGSSMACAEMVGVAAEIFVKDMLATVFSRTRSNGPRYDNGSGGILTGSYRKQITKEEEDSRLRKAQKVRDDDMLPTESKEANLRRPLGMADLRLANGAVRGLFNGMRVIGMKVNQAPFESEHDEWRAERESHKFQDGALNEVDLNGEMDVGHPQQRSSLTSRKLDNCIRDFARWVGWTQKGTLQADRERRERQELGHGLCTTTSQGLPFAGFRTPTNADNTVGSSWEHLVGAFPLLIQEHAVGVCK